MFSDPHSSLPPRNRLRATLGLALLVGLYLLFGLIGHDPWRGDDARYFGPVYSMLRGDGWLFPQIAGEPFTDFPPLYYWVSAILSFLFSGLLPLHDGARLASAFFTALAIYFIARTAEYLHGQPARMPAALLTLGTLGLVLHAHETQPAIALVAMLALTLAGIARIPAKPLAGGLVAGIGSALSFLAGGLAGALLTLPLFPCVMLLCPDCRTPRGSSGLLVGLCAAASIGALWPLAVHLAQPELLGIWLRDEWLRLSQPLDAADLSGLLGLFSWFVWPLWPLALWGLWRSRRRLATLPALLPLLSTLLVIGWMIANGNLSPTSALPLIPPIALLAAGGAPTLRRGAANAFDWFAVMNFAVFALLVWIAWSAQAFSWPPGLAKHVDRVTPGFVLESGPFQAGAGFAICALWLFLVWRQPRAATRGPANWAMGMTMLWCLAVTLLMPWFDYGRSYRPVAQSLKMALARQPADCVASTSLSSSIRSALYYFSDIRTLPARGDETPCGLLLVYDDRRANAPSPAQEWEKIWEFRRGGGKQLEVFRLYLRNPS